jgi:hypothetical protein
MHYDFHTSRDCQNMMIEMEVFPTQQTKLLRYTHLPLDVI